MQGALIDKEFEWNTLIILIFVRVFPELLIKVDIGEAGVTVFGIGSVNVVVHFLSVNFDDFLIEITDFAFVITELEVVVREELYLSLLITEGGNSFLEGVDCFRLFDL
jgi:hypothetical protein